MTVLSRRAHSRLAVIVRRFFTDLCVITQAGHIDLTDGETIIPGRSFSCSCRARTVAERVTAKDGNYHSENTFRHRNEGNVNYIFEVPAGTDVNTDCSVLYKDVLYTVAAVPKPYLDGVLYVQPLALTVRE
jgi:hypothetical protein